MDNHKDFGVLEGLVKKHVEDGRLVLGPWDLLNLLKVNLASDIYFILQCAFIFLCCVN